MQDAGTRKSATEADSLPENATSWIPHTTEPQNNYPRPTLAVLELDKAFEAALPLDEYYKDAETVSEAFKSALRQYESDADIKHKTDFSADGMASWEDLLNAVEAAERKYKSSAGLLGKLRKGLHKLGGSQQTATAWIGLLPSDKYFTILCGGLKLIIGAAARIQKLADEIGQVLEEIPNLLLCTTQTMQSFKNSKDLQTCSAELYVSTITVLSEILAYLANSTLKRAILSLSRQGRYGKNLEDCLETMKRKAEYFDNVARNCAYRDISESKFIQKALLLEQREAQYLTHMEMSMIREQSANQAARTEEQIVALTAVCTDLLGSNRLIDKHPHQVRCDDPHMVHVAEVAQNKERRHRLLEMMNHDNVVVHCDVEENMRSIYRVRRELQDRAIWLMKSTKLHTWIMSPVSATLLVQGNHPSSEREPATSYISAKLVESIKRPREPARKIVALSFFCARHNKPDTPESGPCGMMRSLIAQLLFEYLDFDSSTFDQLSRIDAGNLEDLIQAFLLLMQQLPPDLIVFCILDAVTVLEGRRAWKEDAITIIKVLRELARGRDDTLCVFKVLMTAPGDSRVLNRELDSADILWMPSRISSQGNLTEHQWTVTIE